MSSSAARSAPADAPQDGAVEEMLVVEEKLDALRAEIMLLQRAVVAFSGGADSALVARVATEVLGTGRVLCVTAVSASLAPEELADCAALAREWGLRWKTVSTTELDDPAYSANDGDRCYHCKASLLAALAPWAEAESALVVLGVNLDDLGDHRPGQRAAAERGARFPLVGAGLTKDDVRAVSRHLGLRTWDKPAAACLASRVPYGTPVTLGTLRTVAAAESALRALGFRQLRVRHYGDLARLELHGDDLGAAVDRRHEVVAAVRDAGYRYVTLDLEGFRSGNLNLALGGAPTGVALVSGDAEGAP
ncbi:MAG: ATP-dependent sacrificial sulfur transferase LarE [Acidimicrobiales bacterium]|nr:ATP-dependent sacrificial sulfur transferase LarE [Acidimicrobiales bacterium]